MKQSPRIVIRTEGGPAIGFGHVRRSLSLAQALRRGRAEATFLINDDAAMRREIAALGFEAESIATTRDPQATITRCQALGAQAVVVDSYGFSAAWCKELMSAGLQVVAIDDLGERRFPAGVVVVNCTPGVEPAARRASRPHDLLGPAYALLRPEFAKPVKRRLHHPMRRALITVGGGDAYGLTPRLVEWTRRALGPVRLDVILGPIFDRRIASRLNGHHDNVAYHRQPSNVRGLMLSADLAVSGGGQTTYELAATGTPAIAVRLADNQTRNLQGLAEAGALMWAGNVSDRDLEGRLIEVLTRLAQDPARRTKMSACGRALVDGQGAMRVAQGILEQVAVAVS